MLAVNRYPKARIFMFTGTQRFAAGLLLCVLGGVCGCGQSPAEPARTGPGSTQAMETQNFAVEGMVCDGCVNTVTAAIKAVPGVKSVEVSLKDKRAAVAGDGSQVPSQAIEQAVHKAGYEAPLIPVAGRAARASDRTVAERLAETGIARLWQPPF